MGETFPNASAQALDLIQQCLQFNPDKRISSIDALKHPYVAEFHNPDDEPDYPHGPIRIVIERSVQLIHSDIYSSSVRFAV
jgi:mitogen-activated protein kinase 15